MKELFTHQYLHKTVQFKRNKKQKIESFLQEEKHKLIQLGNNALRKNNRISLYRSILKQKLTFLHLDSLKRSAGNNQDIKWFLAMNFEYDGTFSENIWQWSKQAVGKRSLHRA